MKKTFFILCAICFSLLTVAQQYNTYLVNRLKFKDKEYLKEFNGQMYYTSNPDVVGDFRSGGVITMKMCDFHFQYQNYKIIDQPKFINAFIKIMDYVKAKVDTTGLHSIEFAQIGGREVSCGYMDWLGNFIVPPLFTFGMGYTEAAERGNKTFNMFLFGQRQKQGTWKLFSCRKPGMKPEFIGEANDFMFFTPTRIAYKMWDNRWGLIDHRGQIQTNAIYDSIKYDKQVLGTQWEYADGSFESQFQRQWLYSEVYEDQNKKISPLLRLYKGDSVYYALGDHISPGFINPQGSTHSLFISGTTYHYFIYAWDSTGNYDVFRRDDGKIDLAYKYAYLEQAKMGSKTFYMNKDVDYSRPIAGQNPDSIRRARAQQYVEAIQTIRRDPSNLTNRLTGYYEVTGMQLATMVVKNGTQRLRIETAGLNKIAVEISGETNKQASGNSTSYRNTILLQVSSTGSGVLTLINPPGVEQGSVRKITGTYNETTGVIKLEMAVIANNNLYTTMWIEAKKTEATNN